MTDETIINNLEIWDKLKTPPPDALKKITGGRLKGYTDISPQWRYQVMTETFGICGIGWKYRIVKVWTEPGASNQVFAFAEIALQVKKGGTWSEIIPGTGGSMLIAQETNGLHSSDEGFKMAVTDALSVAMKMLGVGADVYAGKLDGSKYAKPAASTTQPATSPGTGGGAGTMSEKQRLFAWSLAQKVKGEKATAFWTDEKVNDYTAKQASELIKKLQEELKAK